MFIMIRDKTNNSHLQETRADLFDKGRGGKLEQILLEQVKRKIRFPGMQLCGIAL